MNKAQDIERLHIVRQAVLQSIAQGEDVDAQADNVMDLLNDMGVVVFAPNEPLKMLTAAGRMLMVIMEYPEITLREAAVRLGITEQGASRAVRDLTKRGLISRRKVRRRNVYTVNVAAVLEHSDIRRFLLALTGSV